jgi:hypothetical protein
VTDRVSRAAVEDVLDDYTDPQRDAVLNSLGARRKYVAGGRRRYPSELPDFDGPDSEFYEGISRRDLEDFDEALSTIRAGYRIEEEDEDLVLNEEAMYDDIASGSIKFYAPWNVGMDQKDSKIHETMDYLQRFAGILNQETVLDAGVIVYTLDAYARNNGNSFRQTRNEVRKAVGPKKDLSILKWSDFEQQVLGENLDPDFDYDGMRNRESDLMAGKVRISPTENPDQEDKEYVDTTENPKENEAVIYGPFVGPWKSGYDEEVGKVPELLDEMRSVT